MKYGFNFDILEDGSLGPTDEKEEEEDYLNTYNAVLNKGLSDDDIISRVNNIDPVSEQRYVTLDDLLLEEDKIPKDSPEKTSLINFDFAPNYSKKKFQPNTELGKKLFGNIPREKISFKFIKTNRKTRKVEEIQKISQPHMPVRFLGKHM